MKVAIYKQAELCSRCPNAATHVFVQVVDGGDPQAPDHLIDMAARGLTLPTLFEQGLPDDVAQVSPLCDPCATEIGLSLRASVDQRTDILLQLMGVPTAEQLESRLSLAPVEAPELGKAPEGGWVDEIVWVQTDFYVGVAYCDDVGAEPLGVAYDEEEHRKDEEDEEEEEAEDADLPDGLYVYPDKPIEDGYHVLRGHHVRQATKEEVRGWFASLAAGRMAALEPDESGEEQ